MSGLPISSDIIERDNARRAAPLAEDYDALGHQLARRDVDLDAVTRKVAGLNLALPSWGVGTGGTRFARFPGPGEPRGIFEKLDDCAVVHQLGRATPTVSLHIPWDKADPADLRAKASALGLGFDAMNSNTFQDHPTDPRQPLSYKFGSLSHADAAVREQAVAHNIECIEIGRAIGSEALTVWIGDGSNFPGQSHLTRSFERYLDAMGRIYAALPENWRLFSEHKMFEPAFYATVVQDWGTNLLIAQTLGPKAECLVDLGHHAPNVNIEMIVARLAQFGKLGGFHFNDSKYGDDDLDAGSIDPFRLFLVFNELIEAEAQAPAEPMPGVPGHPAKPSLYDRPVPQCHRSDRKPDPLGRRDPPGLCPGAAGRPRVSLGLPRRERRADGVGNLETGLPDRCRPASRQSAGRSRWRHRADLGLSGQPLPRVRRRNASGEPGHRRWYRLRSIPSRASLRGASRRSNPGSGPKKLLLRAVHVLPAAWVASSRSSSQ